MSIGPEDIAALLRQKVQFSLTVAGIPEISQVIRLGGHEGVSELYEFQVEVAAGEIDIAPVVGRLATLELGSSRHVHGEIASIEYVGETARYQRYTLTLVSRLWRLQYRQNCRIFQNQTTAAIIAAVFQDAGLVAEDFRFELAATYAPRNYCVQYRESDLAFVQRLLEEDGIFYFFVHTETQVVLVLADHPAVHPTIAGNPALWFYEGGEMRDREHVTALRLVERVRPGKVSLRDFNFHAPSQRTEADGSVKQDSELEIYDYPGEFLDPGAGGPHQGQSKAKIRLEELQVARRELSGSSDCIRLMPGHRFIIEGHRRADVNGMRVLTRVTHDGSQMQALGEDGFDGSFHYTNHFTCVDRSVPLRPARVTPRPVIQGVQSATVVGPPGEEIHVDEHGRVMVQFHWDRQGQFDDNSSCWVRTSQSWAGPGWGAMFLPRIGHEVLVDFLEGDPDRPIITGRVYHGENSPPYPLPDEKTKSTIRSESSPGGGGFNELRFEDRKGSEEVFFHAQRDLNEVVLNNNTRTVGVNQTFSVGANQTFSVGANQTFTIMDNRSVTVSKGDESLTVATGKSTTTIEQDRSVTVKSGDSSLTVASGTHTMTAKKAIKATSETADIMLTAHAGVSVRAETTDIVVSAKKSVEIKADTTTLALSALLDASLASTTAGLSLKGNKAVSLQSDTSTLTMGSPETATLSSGDEVVIGGVNKVDIQGKQICLTADEEIILSVEGSQISIKADGITISGPKITSEALGMHVISGALIKIN